MVTGGEAKWRWAAVAVAMMAAALVAAANARAAVPDCGEGGECPPQGVTIGSHGEAGGELRSPRGIAADPETGTAYVADSLNSRVSAFDKDGSFLRAWGWGVVASGPGNDPRNEVQRVTVTGASEGAFRLRYELGSEQVSAPIDFDASAAEVREALEAMSNIKPPPAQMASEPGDVAVSGPEGGPWEIEFTGANADLYMLTLKVTSSSLDGEASVEKLEPGANFEICVAADGDACRAGQEGPLAGQMTGGSVLGAALDASGDVWVLDRGNLRAQKFSPEGELILLVGGEVNKTAVALREEQEAESEPVTVTEAEENLCVVASGDECGAGGAGTGEGQFAALGLANPIAAGPGGTIYVGDEDRIQELDEEGNYLGEIPLAGAGVTRSLTVDPSGRIYVISEDVKVAFDSTVAREIGPGGEELGQLQADWQERQMPRDATAVAADAEGNVYVIGQVVYDVEEGGKVVGSEEREEALAFDEEGERISFEADQAGFGRPTDTTKLVAVATNVLEAGSEEPGPVYLAHFDNGFSEGSGGPKSYVQAYGQFGEPPVGPPSIAATYATAVASADAAVEARISPNFAKDTTFRVRYGTAPCSEGGCAQTAPQALGGTANNIARPSGPVTLTGLAPNTTYHFRFVAESEGGGPVEGAEASFHTYAAPAPRPPCPNEATRLGPSAELPDCRAHELVSPADKDGGEVISLIDSPGYSTELSQADPGGEKLTYSSYRAFADPTAAPYTSQYLARRDPAAGWGNEAISPPRGEPLFSDLGNPYKRFSEDLSRAWLSTDSEPPLAAGALAGYRNLYERDNGARSYEAQCSAEPPERAPSGFRFEAQGASADGSHTVFRANDKLTAEAAATSAAQLYECVDGDVLRLVSVAGGEAVAGVSAGSGGASLGGYAAFREGNVAGAVSADGSRIFWTAAEFGPGALYARIEGTRTVQIAAAGARFRYASPDGTRVIYTVGGELRAASVGGEAASSETIAGEVEGVMGWSEDAEVVYLVSREDLDEGGPAEAGEPNLYLHRAGPDELTFIAELSEADARESFGYEETAPILTPVAISPFNRAARVSADGEFAAFASSAPLTGYDNTDQASGEADAEVFLYDADAEELACASCNPGGARPKGANLGDPLLPYWVGATIPGWEDQFHASRALSDDGGRLFFEAVDPLALGDTNGALDVYQWERAGHGTCTAASPTHNPAAKGCVDLISTGKSPQPSSIVDASASGDDVFFKTAQSLWAPDPGLVDVYDARVGGGFAPPPPPPSACEGESCQSPGPAPNFSGPASSAYQGPGNKVSAKKPRRCAKGKRKVKRKGKVRCVKKKGKRANKRHKRISSHRRAKR